MMPANSRFSLNRSLRRQLALELEGSFVMRFPNYDVLAMAFFISLAVSSCTNSTPTGSSGGNTGTQPSGNYVMSAWQCGSTDIYKFLTTSGGTVVSLGLSITDTQGQTIVTYADNCLRTQPFTGSYSGSNVTEVSTSPSCSSSCTNQCSGFVGSTDTYSYYVGGTAYVYEDQAVTQLELSRTLTSDIISANQVLQAAGCTAGQTEAQFWGSVSQLPATTSGTYSCNSPSQYQCYDFTGSYYTSTNAAQACAAFGGSYSFSSTSACATSNRLGSCTTYIYNNAVSIARYYSGGSTWTSVSVAQADCLGRGGLFNAN